MQNYRRAVVLIIILCISLVYGSDDKKKSFQQYKRVFGSHVKRNDYIVMNLKNIEVDVKCISKYKNAVEAHFSLSVQEVKKHIEYSKATGNDLITPMPQFDFPGLKPGVFSGNASL